ncbi:MAG: PAS domain S-box protein [Proteobacteria bacterium]|jgi:PAS domain S-box-containing protein|nr:PAS domain S-box protein [Pseudomonadota bacterium]
MTSFRLRTYLIVYCTIIPLLLTAVIISLYSSRFKDYAIDNLTAYGKVITKNTAFTVADDLITENYAPLQEFLQDIVFRNEDVDAIEISDSQGMILAASDVKLLGSVMENEPAGKCITKDEQGCVCIDYDQAQLIITAPIVVGKIELGKTRVFLPMRASLSHLHTIQRNGVIIGLCCWLLAVSIGYFLARYLTSPLQRFMAAADSISRGGFNVQIPESRWVLELDKFGHTLKAMACAIASREQKIQDSEKKFRQLFERAIEGIFVADGKGQLLDVNPAFLQILSAASRGVLLDQNLFANIFENEEALVHFKEEIARKGFVKDYELTLIKSDSSSVIVSLTCHMVKGNDGSILKYEGLIRDISVQKRAEKEIVRMRNYLNNIIESMPSMLATLDADSIVTQWNSAACRLTGISSRDAIGRKIYDIAPVFSKYYQQVDTIKYQHRPLTLYREKVTEDAEHLYNVTFFPLIANGVNGVALRLDDITELDLKEQQLRQAQKMESVGTLAGGLAHDFNNVLAAILGNLSLLKYKIHSPPGLSVSEIQEYLERMETAGSRAVDMVRQLLTLSRRHQIDLVPVDLNLSVTHVRKIGENTFDKSVQVVVHPSECPAYVLADITEMEQVLLNLCINGIHAMTIMRGDGVWGGILTIAIDKVVVDQLFQKRNPEATGSAYWKISVSDTGVGMDTKTAAKIFDPFFTTKEHGKGTGLGLAMVYNIIRQEHGFIDVYSEPGQGSTFNVYLPLLEREGEEIAPTRDTSTISRGDGIVLVVDDDDIVRKMAEDILQSVGYTVLTAANGKDGVEMYRQHHGNIKVVLLDMVMPVMSGREAFMEMKKINPEVKVLLASGFRQDERVEDILELGVKSFLQKPYTITSLALTMKQVLES